MRRVAFLLVPALLAPILLGFAFSSHTSRVAGPEYVVPPAPVELAIEQAAHADQARHLSALRVAVPLLPFAWPANGTITGVYGLDAGREHPGIDIGILKSLRVRAAAAGRIIDAGYTQGFEGYGKVVVERVGEYTVLYAHLSKVAVHPGERVARDAHVGTAGCTGWCTGTHVHFEVRRGKQTVNPVRLLAAAR